MSGGRWQVETIWSWPSYEETPVIVDAWDQVYVEENPAGFAEAVEKAEKDAEGGPVRVVSLIVSEDAIRSAFDKVVTEAEVR